MDAEPFFLRVPADPSMLATLRRDLRVWLESLQIAADDVASVVAACSEVVAAAIEGGAAPIEITADVVDADIVVRCTSDRRWQVGAHPSRYVAALLVDDLGVEVHAERTAVVLRKGLDRGLRGAEEGYD